MELKESFQVDSPLPTVWDVILDVPRVSGCIPGAELEGQVAEGIWEGNLRVRVGPIGANFRGRFFIEELNPESSRMRMRVESKDTGGRGSANARMELSLAEGAGGTRVEVNSEVILGGKFAQFGRTIWQYLARRMASDFARNLQALLQGKEA